MRQLGPVHRVDSVSFHQARNDRGVERISNDVGIPFETPREVRGFLGSQSKRPRLFRAEQYELGGEGHEHSRVVSANDRVNRHLIACGTDQLELIPSGFVLLVSFCG